MLKKITILMSVFCLGALFSAYIYFKILSFNDISVEPVEEIYNVDFTSKPIAHRKGVYLVSYADGPSVFFKNQHALVLSALNKGIDFFLNYRKSHMDPQFVRKHQDILNHTCGAGYWLWKPWVILHTLQNVPDGAIVIYADTGFVFSNKNITPLINYGKKYDLTCVAYPITTNGPFERIASDDLLNAVGCNNEKCRQSPYTMAGFMVLKNGKKARAFIAQWLKLCENKRLLVDMQNPTTRHANFLGHSYDQTLFNVVRLTGDYNVHLISETELDTYVTWHHRKSPREDFSLIHFMKKQISLIEKGALNFLWIRKIRNWMIN